MERGSAKHGPRLDEHQKQETEGLVRGGRSTHAQEWNEPEPVLDSDEENLTFPPQPPGREPGFPEGMSARGVELRSMLARWLIDAGFPADRGKLIAHAERRSAPDPVVAAVHALPDRKFATVSEVAQALGLGVETRRR